MISQERFGFHVADARARAALCWGSPERLPAPRAGQGPGAGRARRAAGSPPARRGRSKAVTVALSPSCGSPAGTSLGTRLLDVLSTAVPGPGRCRLVPGNCWCLGSRCHADLLSSLHLRSSGNRVFEERRGLLRCIRGLSRSGLLLELRMGYHRNGWIPR